MNGGSFLRAVSLLALALISSGCMAVHDAGGSSYAPALVVPPVSSQASAGCGASAIAPMTDPGTASITGRRGGGVQAPLSGLAVTATDPRVAFIQPVMPSAAPVGLPQRLMILAPWSDAGQTAETRLLVVWGLEDSQGQTLTNIVASGDWVLSEMPADRGQDAAAVESALDSIAKSDHYRRVAVASYTAVLVHQDAMDISGSRPYGLYWSDGIRDLSVQALADPNELIDFARTFYCR